MSLINPDLSGIVDGGIGSAADWITPYNTIINVINGGLDDSNFTANNTNLTTIAAPVTWSTWSPGYHGINSMSYTSVTTNVARYIKIGKLVFFYIDAIGTTGGTPDVQLGFDLPITALQSTLGLAGTATAADTTTIAGLCRFTSTSIAYVYKYDGSNWGIGANRGIRVTGIYESAS